MLGIVGSCIALGLCGGAVLRTHGLGRSLFAAVDESIYAEVPTSANQSLPFASATSSIEVPILVFHVVRPSYPSDSKGVRAIAQTPETFDAEMGYLDAAGYQVVSFDDLERHLADATPLPSHPVIISFDDGWRDQFEYALPVLEKYRYSATFFVFTNAIGRPGFFSWDDLKTLRALGMVIGSHSETHPFLTRIADDAALREEIIGSKRILESKLGITVNEFAYPFGLYNQKIVALVKEAGYISARGDSYSGGQSADREFTLSAMNAGTTLARFQRQLPSHQ